MKKDVLSTRKALDDITSVGPLLTNLLNKGEDSDRIIQVITNRGFNKGSSISLNTLVNKLGFAPKKIRRLILDLHKDLKIHGLKFGINKVSYQITFDDGANEVHYWLESLPVVPRVGDTIEFHYGEQLLEDHCLQVAAIIHELSNDEQNVCIYVE